MIINQNFILPGRASSLKISREVPTSDNARVVGTPKACICSDIKKSRMLERITAYPSPLRA